MADRYWDGGTSTDPTDVNNWSDIDGGGTPATSVPGVADTAHFTANGDTKDCTFTANWILGEMIVLVGYTSKIAMATFDLTTSIGSGRNGSLTFDGAGEFDCDAAGANTIFCNGDFDNKDQGTWTAGNSTLTMTGTGTITSGATKDLHNLTIDGTTTLDAATATKLDVGGKLLINIGEQLTLSDLLNIKSGGDLENDGTLTCNAGFSAFSATAIVNTGTIDGSSVVTITFGTIANSGTWSVTNTSIRRTATIGAGEYGGTWAIFNNGIDATVTFGAGTTVFTGDATFSCTAAAKTYNVDFVANNASVEFQGDLTLNETDAVMVWKRAEGGGTVEFSATTAYTDNTAAIQNIGDVDITSGATVDLATDMECQTFTGTNGTFDPNGNELESVGNMDWQAAFSIELTNLAGSIFTVGGNFTTDVQDFTGASGEWFLNVTGTAVASGIGIVEDSNASGGTEIDASAGPWTESVGDNNTNWNFGAAGLSIPIAMHHYKQIMGAN